MGWKKFNDRLALLLIIVIPLLWVTMAWTGLPETVVGATILAWGLVVQYYFRKGPPKDEAS